MTTTPQPKTVTILANNNGLMIATNAKTRNVWKEVGPNTYVFSHVETLKPTHTLEEFVGGTTKPGKQEPTE